jgi:hypothetical protein
VLTLDDARAALFELRATLAYAFAKGARCEGGRAYPLYQEVLAAERDLVAVIAEHQS